MTPRPPSWAIAMASEDSVTVSIAALSSGTFRRMLRVSRVETSTCVGSTVECCGTSSTSSKVSAVTMPVSTSLSVSSGVFSSICDSTRRRPLREDRSRRGAVTLLVFLAAATGTRIVPADLRLLAPELLDDVVSTDAGWLRTARVRHGRRRHRRLGTAGRERRNRLGPGIVHRHLLGAATGAWNRRRFLVEHRTKPEEGADHLLFDARFHVLEERVAFFL